MSGNKLLLADDSMTIQKVVQLTFADEGIDVSVAPDGDMAMLRFAEVLPDIVLADVHMPGLDGYEVCERIKQGDRKVPVVLLVGSFEPFDTDRAHQVGADAFLTKPFQSIRQLVDIVSNLLAADGGSEAAPPAPAAAEQDIDEFAETREILHYSETADLGDSGMDDEMIETIPADSLLADAAPQENTPETAAHQFDDEPLAGSMEDTLETDIPVDRSGGETEAGEPEYEAQPAPLYDTAETRIEEPFAAETAAASAFAGSDSGHSFEIMPESAGEDIETAGEGEAGPAGSHGFEIVPEPPRYEAPVYEAPVYEAPPVYTPPVMDDSNLLEIPFSAGAQAPAQEEILEPAREEAHSAPSPELVEAVTQRVMEKMNDDFFKNLIREIVPTVVREIAEEKMGE